MWFNALVEQNVEIPAGQLGQPPSGREANPSNCRCVSSAGSPVPQIFNNIIVKNSSNGLVLLKDVGHSEVGAEDYSSVLKYSGRTAMGIGVMQLSNAKRPGSRPPGQGRAGGTLQELSARPAIRHRL